MPCLTRKTSAAHATVAPTISLDPAPQLIVSPAHAERELGKATGELPGTCHAYEELHVGYSLGIVGTSCLQYGAPLFSPHDEKSVCGANAGGAPSSPETLTDLVK